jgi:2-amino-4-hydroxy-6-hydroxymethyldihydropteridine diphosphokinase
MPRIAVRKAERSDANRLALIAFEAWEQGILPLLAERPGMRETERQRLAHVVAETLDRIIVADIDGIAVGWCSRARGRAYIPFLFVMPDLQGQGIGTMLLNRMESVLELMGADRVHLETPADNVRTVRFYEKLGYQILALRSEGPTAHEPFMSVHLEKRLRPFVGSFDDED